MLKLLRLPFIVLVCVLCPCAQDRTAEDGPKAVVQQKNEGVARTRRPREGVASPGSDFLLKIGPSANGSKHLLLFTEEIPPGAAIPKHKHHGEDEILLIQTGDAHVWLGDNEYDVQPGAVIFIPANTWISLKNTGDEKINLVSIWNEPAFEAMLLCGSVPKGETGDLLSRDEVNRCYRRGDAELDVVQSPLQRK